jgi:hypothetical protein
MVPCLIPEKAAQFFGENAWFKTLGQVKGRIALRGLRFELPKYCEISVKR